MLPMGSIFFPLIVAPFKKTDVVFSTLKHTLYPTIQNTNTLKDVFRLLLIV